MLKLKSFFDAFDKIERDKSRRNRKKFVNKRFKEYAKRITERLKRIEYRRTITANVIRNVWHTSHLELGEKDLVLNFNSLRIIKYVKRVGRVYNKLKLKNRLLVVFVNSKNNKFEYRKRREERLFYKKLIRNLKICMTHPFITKRNRGPIFHTRLPKQVKPVEETYAMVRRRFLQPVFIRTVLKVCKPHNGLRKRRRRRL